MAQDISKQLDRARRSLEKNKLREAVAEYQSVLEEAPSSQEALQALADIYTRLNEPAMAAQYYGAQFDRLVEVGDVAKASAIFTRFLRQFPQPSDRLMRYGTLLQKQGRPSDAIEQFSAACDQFLEEHRGIEAMACCESIALLDPGNPDRHAKLGELAEKFRHSDLATRSFLRAGQLTLATGALDGALEYFERAQKLAPEDRSVALLFAGAKLRKGDDEGAVALLDPFAANETDGTFLGLFGEALLRTGRLDHAREVLQAYYVQKPESFAKLFELIGAYVLVGEDQKGADLLVQTKESMKTVRKESEMAVHMDRLAIAHPGSIRLAETVAHIYEELNREAKYFDALVRLFDLYYGAERMKEACDVMDRLVDIDPYDYRNQERIAKLEGKADPAFLQNILARAAKAATVSTRTDGFSGAGSEIAATAGPVSEEARAQQALEDLIVQVEIFLQYSLQTKAVERLERIAEMFPGHEDKNERLRALYDRANWWPRDAERKPKAAVPIAPPPAAPAPPAEQSAPVELATSAAADTHRDLSAIAEINRLMYRHSTPAEVLGITAAEIGRHMAVSRCLVAVGGPDEATPLTGEYFGPGIASAGTKAILSVAQAVSNALPDPWGGIELRAGTVPGLRELGLESALAVLLADKETQATTGTLLVGDSRVREWKQNESFFLQAVGDQLLFTVNHARLRSLVRSLALADEKTGLISRGAYLECVLAESNRARAQNTPLSLIVLQVDQGGEFLRQYGDVALDHYMEQLANALIATVRQTDLTVKYTAWSLVFILPNTSLENAVRLAEKLRTVASHVKPYWGADGLALSAVVAQITSRPGDETEDRVTEWINRAEAGIEELQSNGGDAVLQLATP